MGIGAASEPAVVDVLVIQSAIQERNFIERALSAEGYCVRTVAGGSEGLAAAALGPRLILLSLDARGPDGVSMLRELRARGDASFVIVVSARATVREARDAMMLDAHDYLSTPLDLELLKNLVREGLRCPDWIEKALSCAI